MTSPRLPLSSKSFMATETIMGDTALASDEQAELVRRDRETEIRYSKRAPLAWSVWSKGEIIGAGRTLRDAVRDAL